ncbi:hypothetical protein BK125_28235 [Paenibacillus odorifer]|uniref:Uncharacterized protein n=1 Tax=Paenibacillus odorifer TaxID=189426 RepID=A0ABX3GFW3_9BACL|nr:hypothetical protein [Paenibacillus odorifer]OMC67698.1 hypothetical protein BK125_28235 [Paenibacillus odorifer]OMD02744.1 hypothetical protein BSO21_32325 [Paenibacillus odorifer]
MMKDHAKFTGEIAKGIKIGESSVEVKLLIPLKAALPHLLFLSSNQGEEVNVFLGDPQAAFDFSEEDEVYREVTGRRVTTDASGVVMSTDKIGEEDPDQANLFEQQEGGVDGEQKTGDFEIVEQDASEDAVGTQTEDGQQEDGSDLQTEGAELEPDWMNDGAGTDSQDYEGDPVESGEQENIENGGNSDLGEAAADEMSKEELDAFILAERPIFPEVEYDGQPIPFPVLLEKRINEDKTWREIANENGMTSGQLSTRWTAYRKLAAKKMKGGGGAA